MKSAIVIGSTGLVGSYLVEKLAQEPCYSQILVILRNKGRTLPPAFSNPKIRLIPFDFVSWPELLLQVSSFIGNSVSHFYCCLGSTIAAAGSQEVFRKIDHDYVVYFAQLAQKNKAESLLVVSALGADPESTVFYNNVKGETERDIQSSYSGKLYILRPSLLLGDRNEFRFAERVAILLSPLYSSLMFGPLKKYKPVHAGQVAKTMVEIATGKVSAAKIIPNEEILKISQSH